MTVRLSAAVMTHPSRLAAATALRDTCPELELRIVVDPDPSGTPSAARTAALAWGAVRPRATHHLVLQDDVVLPDGFAALLDAVVAARPADAICLFTEWGSLTSCAMRLAAWSGQAWVDVCDAYTPTVALVLPADVARAVVAAPPAVPQDDVVIAAVLRQLGVRASATVPNLVEHGSAVSLVGNGAMGLRRACCFTDPSGVDWHAAQVSPRLVPCLSRSYPRPFYLQRDAREPFGWRLITPAAGLALRVDGPTAVPVDAGPAAARLVAAHPDLRADIAVGLWLTAWLSGVEVGPASGRPTGRCAFQTLGVGVFDQYLPPDRLLTVAPALTSYTMAAFEAGRTAPAAVGAR